MGGITSFSCASEVILDTYPGPYIGAGLNHQYTIGDALIDSLVYARVGFTGLHNDFQNYKTFKTNLHCEWISPIVGIGFEKQVIEHCTVRFEGDYRFHVDKKA